MIQQFAAALQKKIREDMNTKTEQVSNGACKSYEDYKQLCGEIRGLALAEEHLLDLAKKVEQNDE